MPPTAPADAPASWYVLYSKPHCEAAAERHLRGKGIEAFHPQLELPEYAAGRRRYVPLFPNYLFVRIHLLTRFHDVVWSPGVKSFVGPGGVPTPLDEAVMTFLRRNATADGTLRARSNLKTGQEVEIVNGPFAGLIGIIQNPPDTKGRIRVLMRLLNQHPVRVQVPVQFVRSNWVA